MRIHARFLAALILVPLLRLPAQARPEPGSELTVYLMTMGPGDQVWERFGHNAIWIRDNARNTDVAYNWGLFDFGKSDFIPRLARGDMLYWMEGFDMRAMMDVYVRSNRPVWAQELNLTPAERARVRELAEINALPRNREYIYDYYRDNCSTRPRDLLDSVVGGAIRGATSKSMTASSYRSHTQRLLADDAAAYSGAMLALGHPADRPISKWEEMFLPMKLREHIRAVSVTRDGRAEPLVKSERVMFASSRPPEPTAAPDYTLRYLVAGLFIALLVALPAWRASRGSRWGRPAFHAAAGAWALVSGLAGLGLLLAWTSTSHVFMYRNENLLQLNPLPLVLLVVVMAAAVARRGGKAGGIVAAVIAGLSVSGFLLQALPAFDQPNGEIIALALPPHLAVAASLLALNRPARS